MLLLNRLPPTIEPSTANCQLTMIDKLASIEGQYEKLLASLGTQQVQSDANEYRKQAKALAEIEPLVPASVSKYFGEHNYNVVTNPKVKVHIDDARHYLLTTKEKFDGITSDPLDPWVKGAASLYSKEYFEMVRAHLKPGGLVTQWVPLYESDFATVKSEIATFFAVFPDAAIFGNMDLFDQGYDLVMLGSDGPLRPAIDAVPAQVCMVAISRRVAAERPVPRSSTSSVSSAARNEVQRASSATVVHRPPIGAISPSPSGCCGSGTVAPS